MANDIWYSIKGNRIKNGYVSGFDYDESGKLIFNPRAYENVVFIKSLDGMEKDAEWGRINCNLILSEEIVCYTYVMSVNIPEVVAADGSSRSIDELLADPDIEAYDKIRFMMDNGAKRLVNCDDALLYDMNGQYMYIAMEMLGSGEGSVSNIRVSSLGDNFMAAFPQVYQERNSFFHRYMSIFSSIYNDISDINAKLYEMLDLNTCSSELLEMYGSWFGIDLKGGFLKEDVLRTIVKEAYTLNRMKGTRKGIQRILEIVLEEEVVLIENRDQGGGVFDVTVLINKRLNEELRHQLIFLLDQFKPLRTQIRLLQMEKDAVMDGNSYLDMNATIPGEKNVVLDEETLYDGAITLK